MGNCLMTKLKASVNNDNLPIFGKITINVVPLSEISDSEQQSIYIEGTDFTVEVSGGGYFSENYADLETPSSCLTSQTYQNGVVLYFANVASTIRITNTITNISVQSINVWNDSIFAVDLKTIAYSQSLNSLQVWQNSDVSVLKNLPNLIYAYFVKCNGDFGFVRNSPLLEELRAYDSSSGLILLSDVSDTVKILAANNIGKGDLSSLTSKTGLGTLELENADVTGSITDIGGLTSLETFNLFGTSVTGSIEDFVAAQVNAGRTSFSGEFRCYSALSFLTFGGNTYPNEAYQTHFLTWNGNKIVIYTGDGELANCPRVYAKGATAQEIAAWEQAGKTVIVIN
jgi:hypothetical protein